jgi:hypothetical protein
MHAHEKINVTTRWALGGRFRDRGVIVSHDALSAVPEQRISFRPDLKGSPIAIPSASRRLSCWQGQQFNPSQHGPEEPPRQMALGQQQPLIAGVFHQAPARLHEPLFCPCPGVHTRADRLLGTKEEFTIQW